MEFFRYCKNHFKYKFFKILLYLLIGFLLYGLSSSISIAKVNAAENETFYSKVLLGRFANDSWEQIGQLTSNSNSLTLTGISQYDYYPLWLGFYGSKSTNFEPGKIYNLSFRINYPSTNFFDWKKAVQYASMEINVSNSSVSYCTMNINNLNYSEFTCEFTVSSTSAYYEIDINWWNVNLYQKNIGYILDSYAQTLSFDLTLTSNTDWGGQIVSQNEIVIGQNEQIISGNNKIIEQNEEAENTRKGIWETIKDLPNAFLNMLKSLFIPDDDYFSNWFDDLQAFLEQKLGFLATPFTLLIDFINLYLNLDSTSDIIINIPDISVPNFEDTILIKAQSFNWSELLKSKSSLLTLWNLYLDFIDVFLILNFLGLCENTYARIFGGDTSNYEYYTVEDSYTYDNSSGEVLSSRRNERTTTKRRVE